MKPDSYKYGGLTFSPNEIIFVRRLALEQEIKAGFWSHYHGERTALLLLKSRGICTEHSNGKEGKSEVITYRATDLMRELADKHRASTLTFDAMAKKLCRNVSPSAVRAKTRRNRLEPKIGHVYPSQEKVSMALAVEFQGSGITVVPAVEPDEVPLFSSRGLTDWYVGEFCKLNHLRPTF